MVDDLGDAVELIRTHRVERGEVEAEPVRRDERAGLVRLRRRARSAAPGAAGGWRCGCGGSPGGGAASIFAVAASPARTNPSSTMPRWTKRSGVGLTRVVDVDDAGFGADRAGVADLAARFAVERRAVEDDLDRLPGLGLLQRAVRTEQGRRSWRRRSTSLVAEELGLPPASETYSSARSRDASWKAAPPRLAARWAAIAASNPA